MSQQQQESASQQPQVRHIPIYVEGRSEPLLNTSPKSQPSSGHPSAQPPSHSHVPPPHPSGGSDSPMPDDLFKQNSIFDRDRDIPVRSAFNTPFFKREPSPGASRTSPFPDMASHMPHMNTNVPRGSSIPRQTPSPPTAAGANQAHHHQHHHSKQPQQPSTAYHQQFPPQRHPQQQQQPAPPPAHHSEQPQQAAAPPAPQPPTTGYDQPDSRPKPPPPPPVNDPTSKISSIQQDVTAIFDLVEQFKGSKEGKKDKTYMYLDEMLTQNLLKLDSIDVGDQPQIKSSRKAAIRSINTCIGVLEQKAEAGALEAAASGGSSSSITGRTEATANGIDPPKGGMNGLEQQHAAGKSASNTSISHSSSNSSQQQQQPIDDAKQ